MADLLGSSVCMVESPPVYDLADFTVSYFCVIRLFK